MTSVRPAIASDVAAIVRVADDDYPADGPAGDVDDDPAPVARGKMRVLLDNRAVVGTAVPAPRQDHLLLRTVAVAPSHRSGGHGRRLIAFAEEKRAVAGSRRSASSSLSPQQTRSASTAAWVSSTIGAPIR
jgi:GNAT superfamily N-acetyltransferase